MKSSAKIAVAVAVIAVAIAAYIMSARNPAGTPQVAGPPLASDMAETVPTVDFLKSHPDALVDAQKRCDAGNGQEIVALCDAVHGAKASLMADKFRQGASGGAK